MPAMCSYVLRRVFRVHLELWYGVIPKYYISLSLAVEVRTLNMRRRKHKVSDEEKLNDEEINRLFINLVANKCSIDPIHRIVAEKLELPHENVHKVLRIYQPRVQLGAR